MQTSGGFVSMFTNLIRWLTSRRVTRGNLTPGCVCAGKQSHIYSRLVYRKQQTSDSGGINITVVGDECLFCLLVLIVIVIRLQ